MRTEYLFWFSDRACYEGGKYVGIMPGHYYLAKGRADYKAAINAGGKDVSDNDAHWAHWERELAEPMFS